MDVDHPFLFAIRDTESDAVLFRVTSTTQVCDGTAPASVWWVLDRHFQDAVSGTVACVIGHALSAPPRSASAHDTLYVNPLFVRRR